MKRRSQSIFGVKGGPKWKSYKGRSKKESTKDEMRMGEKDEDTDKKWERKEEPGKYERRGRRENRAINQS